LRIEKLCLCQEMDISPALLGQWQNLVIEGMLRALYPKQRDPLPPNSIDLKSIELSICQMILFLSFSFSYNRIFIFFTFSYCFYKMNWFVPHQINSLIQVEHGGIFFNLQKFTVFSFA